MKLISADPYRIQITVSHPEFDHQMVFNHPELLGGFREARQELINAWEQGAFDAL
jgi:hypothetical protein